MRTIHKYVMTGNGQDFKVPIESQLIYTAYVGRGSIALWFDLETDNPKVTRKFRIYGTGRHVYHADAVHVGSVIEPSKLSDYVWHIYEVP